MSTYTNLLYHFVFSTKERRPLIADKFRERLHEYIGGTLRGLGGTALEINIVADHIHILARLKPYPSVADVLRKLKANASKWLNEEVLRIRKFGWQDGYAAFSVSESQAPRVRKYIQNQTEHHLRMDYKTELLQLLKKHKVEYDERYLWK
jgi:REP element-mobilizing transposase RayT